MAYTGRGRVTGEIQEMIYVHEHEEESSGTRYVGFLGTYSYQIDEKRHRGEIRVRKGEKRESGVWSLYLASLSEKNPTTLKFLEDDLPAWRRRKGWWTKNGEDDEYQDESDLEDDDCDKVERGDKINKDDDTVNVVEVEA
jgi:hypothetical protein